LFLRVLFSSPPHAADVLRRLWPLSRGVNPTDEARLMISEKIDAAIEAGSMMFAGRDPRDVITFYRRQVAANETRLSQSERLPEFACSLVRHRRRIPVVTE
jgi:hypothetical protein